MVSLEHFSSLREVTIFCQQDDIAYCKHGYAAGVAELVLQILILTLDRNTWIGGEKANPISMEHSAQERC